MISIQEQSYLHTLSTLPVSETVKEAAVQALTGSSEMQKEAFAGGAAKTVGDHLSRNKLLYSLAGIPAAAGVYAGLNDDRGAAAASLEGLLDTAGNTVGGGLRGTLGGARSGATIGGGLGAGGGLVAGLVSPGTLQQKALKSLVGAGFYGGLGAGAGATLGGSLGGVGGTGLGYLEGVLKASTPEERKRQGILASLGLA